MDAVESLRVGDLQQTLTQLQDQVRQAPSNAAYRVFLFQLLSVLGQWDRALTQLNVAGDLDAGTLAMVQTYREALRCEALRADVFAGTRSPLVFGEPDQWVALVVEALRLTGLGYEEKAQQLREVALETAPAVPGEIVCASSDGEEKPAEPFEWIADADSHLGPILEAVVNGRYYWVPFPQIRSMLVEPPTDLRDLVWLPARFQWINGGETVGLVPSRYAGSERSDNDDIRLARRTEWLPRAENVFLGLGQRMLTTDAGDYPLMQVRRITLHSPEGT